MKKYNLNGISFPSHAADLIDTLLKAGLPLQGSPANRGYTLKTGNTTIIMLNKTMPNGDQEWHFRKIKLPGRFVSERKINYYKVIVNKDNKWDIIKHVLKFFNLQLSPEIEAKSGGLKTNPITSFRLGNFKAFAEAQSIPIRPITLIFGPNSGGKSSVIHSLVLAHEANRTGNLDVFHTKLGGTSIDLGGFRQYIHRRQANRRLEWGISFDTSKLTGKLAETLDQASSISINLSIGIQLDDHSQPLRGDSPNITSYELQVDGNTLLRMSPRPDGFFRLDGLDYRHIVIKNVIIKIIQDPTTKETVSEDDFIKAFDEILPALRFAFDGLLPTCIEDTEQSDAKSEIFTQKFISFLDELVSELNKALQTELERMKYLGPLRSYPPRHQAFSQHDDLNWHAGGGYAWDEVRTDAMVRDAVNKWLGSSFLKTTYELSVRDLVAVDQLTRPLEQGVEQIELVTEPNYYNPDMEPDYVADPEPFDITSAVKDPREEAKKILETIDNSDIDRVRELILVDRLTNTEVSHRDVGIGISQVLPVLVLAFGSINHLVAIEQPEIHLHPALQAELGDVFIESALGERGNTFILETHSEHLILRILRRIRETTDGELPKEMLPITPEQVAVLYVQPQKEGAQVIHLPVTEEGEFEPPCPEGFFAERAKELF